MIEYEDMVRVMAEFMASRDNDDPLDPGIWLNEQGISADDLQRVADEVLNMSIAGAMEDLGNLTDTTVSFKAGLLLMFSVGWLSSQQYGRVSASA